MYDFLKRLIDVCGSVFCLILFFPISVVTVIVIQLDCPGSILADTPNRVGKGGKEFRFYKFRSMIPNAHQLLHTDPKFKKLLEEYKKSSFKLHDDPRITRVGKFIRKYSIDEIPQFINVLEGDMSIVGPRAYYPFELKEQQENYPKTKDLVREVLKVKPGITGPWQVSGRSSVNFDKRIEMDARYARRRSIVYDLIIMIKTPMAMITGKGAI